MSTVESICLGTFLLSAALLGYTLFLYPAVMALVGRLSRPQQLPEPESWPVVSMIIPAYNEELVIAQRLRNAAQLNYPAERLEIIVASDGSQDSTVEISRSFESAGVRVLDLTPNRGKATALNEAVAVSKGDVLCLGDANVFLQPDALRCLVMKLKADATIGAVSANVRIVSKQSDFGTGESEYYHIERAIQIGESAIGSMMGVDGGLYVLDRERYRPLATDTTLDDFTISMQTIQQGFRVIFEPTAIAVENGTPTWGDEASRRRRIGAGVAQSLIRGAWPPLSRPIELWQYISHKLLRWTSPVLIAVLFLANGFLITTGWPLQVCFVAQCLFHGSAVAGWLFPRLREFRPIGLTFYFTFSHVELAVGIAKGICRRSSGRWSRTARTQLSEAALPSGLKTSN